MLFSTIKDVEQKRGILKIQDAQDIQSNSARFPTAVSRSASVFLPETFSLPPCSVRTARAVVVVPVVPTLPRARAANARLAVESWAAQLAQSGSALADYSAGLPADDSARAVVPAELWAAGSVPAYLAAAGMVVLTAHSSTPADYSRQADRSGQRCSRDASAY